MPPIRTPLSFAALVALSVTAGAQRALTPGVQRFVSVDAPIVALTHAHLVDGTGAPARSDQTIIIRGSRIEAVGPSSTTTVPAGALAIDLTGHTVMPGQVGLHRTRVLRWSAARHADEHQRTAGVSRVRRHHRDDRGKRPPVSGAST